MIMILKVFKMYEFVITTDDIKGRAYITDIHYFSENEEILNFKKNK